MKISLQWLNEFVEIEDYFSKINDLADILTFAGLEVENIENQASKYEFVLTALILKKEQHPEADRLTVCQVTTGNGVVHQIVCGAKNHNENDRVVVALPGAKLPNGLEIKESFLRNQASKGMLCSREELGLIGPNDGILLLSKDAPIGESFAKFYGLNDIILELKVTPNRSDCLSHLGLAREISCLLGRPLKAASQIVEPELQTHSGVEGSIQVEILNVDSCLVYMGAVLRDIQVAPSPVWLQDRLEKLGLKSINNVVDVTSYVMIERGQPLHAFDMSQIRQSKISVRNSDQYDKFVSLDGTSFDLNEGDLCIADAERVLALAGIVGGKNSGVTEKTQDVFLEAAAFRSDVIRKTSRKLGIQTDSAYRFSRGVDGSSVRANLIRAIQLLQEVSGAKWSGELITGNQVVEPSKTIKISVEFVAQKLGYPVREEDFILKMKQLGCLVEPTSKNLVLSVSPPSYRFDLEQSVDLVEEYGRLNGYDKIPESLPAQTGAPTQHQKEYLYQRRLAQNLMSQEFNELVLPLFVDPKRESLFFGKAKAFSHFGFSDGESISLVNPLNEDHGALRRQLSIGLLDRALYNIRQGMSGGILFEVGVVTSRAQGYQENYHLSAVSWGEPTEVWEKKQSCPLVIQFKDQIVKAMRPAGVDLQLQRVMDRSELPDFLHLGQSAWFTLNGDRVGFVGHIHPSWSSEHKVRVPLCIMEVRCDLIFKVMGQISEYQAFSRYPYIERDLSLVVPRNLASQTLEVCFQKSLNKYIQGIELFDIYEGDKLPAGYKQLGYRFKLQKSDGTLSDVEVNQVIEDLLVTLKLNLGVQLREA